MKRNRVIKISVTICLAIVLAYYVLSILIVRNGQFVNYHFPAQLSVENSIYNNNFIRQIRPDEIKILDSAFYADVKNDLEIYLCEAYYYKHYGILNLFNHRVEFDNSICLNLNLKRRQKAYIKYGDDFLKRMGDSNAYRNVFRKGSSVNVKIFNKDKKEAIQMTFLNLRE